MREFNTREAEGDYSITFETDDRKAFEQVQTLCRILIDGKDGDSIPIEWINSYTAGLIFSDDYVDNVDSIDYYIDCIKEMVRDWKKENDYNKRECI